MGPLEEDRFALVDFLFAIFIYFLQGFWSMIHNQWKELGRLSNEDFKRHHDQLVREDLLKYTARNMHTPNVPPSIGDYDIDGLSPSNVVLKSKGM